MAVVNIDALGLKCPLPILRIASKVPEMSTRDILEVAGDCPTFEKDVRKWCEREKKTLLAVNKQGSATVVQIQF